MNINISCPVNNTGYGLASINILKSLNQKKTNVCYFPIGSPSVSSEDEHKMLIEMYTRKNEIDINAPYIKIWHQFDLYDHIGKGKYYAFPFFELDTFNSQEKLSLSVPDTIFATSKWAKNIIEQNISKSSVDVIPLGVDTNLFDYTKIQKTRDDNKYIFLNIGKWEIRKGHDFIYKVFSQAFPKEQDVELWILASEKTNNYSNEEELKSWKEIYSKDDRIKIFNGADNQYQIAQLIANSDCGLYPSRAEGWNLELLETMAMNKPVIATNYSAHTEFCNNDNCMLVDIYSTEKAFDNKAFVGQGNWAKIGPNQIEQTINHMRYCYNNKISTNHNGVITANTYSWSNTADHILRCIS
jgi:glycosyltransferase involved in cell wall biosynthesis